MGGFKNEAIPHAEDGYIDWLDDHNPPMNDVEIEIARVQTIMSEISRINEWLVWKLDNMRYYKDDVSQEEIAFLIKETRRIERDLG